jgi:hypothetical protein
MCDSTIEPMNRTDEPARLPGRKSKVRCIDPDDGAGEWVKKGELLAFIASAADGYSLQGIYRATRTLSLPELIEAWAAAEFRANFSDPRIEPVEYREVQLMRKLKARELLTRLGLRHYDLQPDTNLLLWWEPGSLRFGTDGAPIPHVNWKVLRNSPLLLPRWRDPV